MKRPASPEPQSDRPLGPPVKPGRGRAEDELVLLRAALRAAGFHLRTMDIHVASQDGSLSRRYSHVPHEGYVVVATHGAVGVGRTSAHPDGARVLAIARDLVSSRTEDVELAAQLIREHCPAQTVAAPTPPSADPFYKRLDAYVAESRPPSPRKEPERRGWLRRRPRDS